MKVEIPLRDTPAPENGRVLAFKTRFGYSAILYRENPFKIFRTFLPRSAASDLSEAIGALGCFRDGRHESARRVSRSIIDYFEGRPFELQWPPWALMEVKEGTVLQQSVWRETAKIPYGKLKSYREIAEAIGRPKACRFVGTALAKNPLPLLIPCHRVIRSDGTPGRFGGGTPLKSALIDLEKRCAPDFT